MWSIYTLLSWFPFSLGSINRIGSILKLIIVSVIFQFQSRYIDRSIKFSLSSMTYSDNMSINLWDFILNPIRDRKWFEFSLYMRYCYSYFCFICQQSIVLKLCSVSWLKLELWIANTMFGITKNFNLELNYANFNSSQFHNLNQYQKHANVIFA